MKYSQQTFEKEVDSYKKILTKKIKGKLVFVTIKLKNEKAFYSVAPLSKAVHELGGELQVSVGNGRSQNLKVMQEVWEAYAQMKRGAKDKRSLALKGFIKSANNRIKGEKIDYIFEKPEIILKDGKKGFEGDIEMPYFFKWHKKYRWGKLNETARKLWKNAYNLKKNERASIGFVLIPESKHQELPLEDYLDSFSMAYAMAVSAKSKVSLGASSDKASMIEKGVRSGEMLATLIGCEYDKDIKEDVFEKFRVLSKAMNISRLKTSDAGFGIHGKGYPGRFLFGEHIGFPTPNRKTRWSSTGQMFLKDRFEAQTYEEPRPPRMRYAMTETLPIDEFIETNDVNFNKLRKKSDKIKAILDKCEVVRVVGKNSDFTVFLTEGKKRNKFNSMNWEVRHKYDKPFFRKTGIKAGLYANIPDGETFVTPIRITGRICGDVVLSLDRSTPIPKNKPLIIEVDKKGNYKIKSGDRKIISKIINLKKDVMNRIQTFEKSKSLPKSMTDMYRRNFNSMGEFAINVNPKAKLSRYLIVNEKLANMIHVALGMGFEPDKKTLYHWDVVIDAPRQKMEIYGVDKKGKEHYVMRRGRLCI